MRMGSNDALNRSSSMVLLNAKWERICTIPIYELRLVQGIGYKYWILVGTTTLYKRDKPVRHIRVKISIVCIKDWRPIKEWRPVLGTYIKL